jgi:hypothetical protein
MTNELAFAVFCIFVCGLLNVCVSDSEYMEWIGKDKEGSGCGLI